ncbi:uncharacterized protein LOC129216888 [Uloborus diversus]|uniref:uncharacterized protein LOC129216888 n=1 Tax=Uloborus diversus TaxID=327109 RepID=UPI0024095E83|nr:uncharacterized protein LOC129216888 [Uloborus diversus]
MEDRSVLDIEIRNVPVRLNDVGSEMNGDCVNSLFISSNVANEEATHATEINDGKCAPKSVDISDEFREKLNVCRDSTSNCALINGCNKFLHDDMKCVDISMNGLTKCSNLGILNAHLDKLSHRTRIGQPVTYSERTNTESTVSDALSFKCAPDSSVNSSNDVCGSDFDAKSNVTKCAREESCPPVLLEQGAESDVNITYLGYDSECQMPDIMRLIQKDLSEPYSIYTYRYFIHNWPKLCFLAQHGNKCVGAIVCKLDVHKKHSRRGYIAMLAVDEKYRKRKIGSNLVLKAIHAMVQDNADEVVLETEITNKPALRLYENLGFVRDKRLFRYYLNGVDALRLKLWLR